MQGPPKEKRKDDASQTDDERERAYYYDDAHGYEVYDPDKEGDGDESDDQKACGDQPAASS